MIGIRQVLRNTSTFLSNLHALPKVFQIICNDRVEVATLSAARRLVARGHSHSIKSRLPVELDGSPIPWYTYPIIDYFRDINTSDWHVLEFGSGQSTHFWAARSQSVISYEHSPEWKNKLQKKNLPNVEVRLFKKDSTLSELSTLNHAPDLIVIDGWKRMYCAQKTIEIFGLKPIYILENADWFPDASALMRDAGFVEIRFKGFGPINGYAWSTSLLLSPENLSKLKSISASSIVPGGLAPGDYEQKDLNS